MNTEARALLIDLDGVLYQGERAIPGARNALDWLYTNKIPHLFVTNTTSRPRGALIEKLGRLKMQVDAGQLLTPPVAAARWLSAHVKGRVALFVPHATLTEFEQLEIADKDATLPVAAVVLGDYGERWTFEELNRAFRWLMHESKPELIALGMTRYWRAEDGLRLDTAPFVAALECATGRKAVVLGKPAAPFFRTALEQLGASAPETLMIGDDIRGDIDGAQQIGIRGLLVKTGKFTPADLDLGIQPAAVLDSFADLPTWWENHLSRLPKPVEC
ncbi:MAG: TIGR01458 family HAD-type hydrolase [Gammaproteobacteria bacterium]|nr:TIGR01458 family HAD-type hydrolase [Gammaproteobacteria bacterium]